MYVLSSSKNVSLPQPTQIGLVRPLYHTFSLSGAQDERNQTDVVEDCLLSRRVKVNLLLLRAGGARLSLVIPWNFAHCMTVVNNAVKIKCRLFMEGGAARPPWPTALFVDQATQTPVSRSSKASVTAHSHRSPTHIMTRGSIARAKIITNRPLLLLLSQTMQMAAGSLMCIAIIVVAMVTRGGTIRAKAVLGTEAGQQKPLIIAILADDCTLKTGSLPLVVRGRNKEKRFWLE